MRLFALSHFRTFALLFVAILSLAPASVEKAILYEILPVPDLSETSSGLASGLATPDGRPLFWKSRDRVVEQDMEYHYVSNEGIPFISVCDNGIPNQYYGGVNAAGFGIMNTDAHNITPNNPGSNGWGVGDDDGETMNLALATCRTVDDFQAELDSLNLGGRTNNFNYGVLDAFGGASYFEAAAYTYTRFDAADAPGGFLIRTNYSDTGDDVGDNDALFGLNRRATAYRQFKKAAESDSLTPQYILHHVVRNLSLLDLTLDDLPFDGYYQDYPYGIVPNNTAVCRYDTRAVTIVQGVRAGDNPDNAILWAMVGPPLGSVATPLWVRAGSVPVEYDGSTYSSLCRREVALKDWTFSRGNFGSGVDTWRLINPQHTGLWDFTLRLEDWANAKTAAFLRSPNFSYDRLEAFQNAIAAEVADSLDAWTPVTPVNEIAEPIYADNQITLAWIGLHRDAFGNEREPRDYRVFWSASPFRESDSGQLVGEVANPTFSEISRGSGFYRVEAVYD